jgi:hypothetical protein
VRTSTALERENHQIPKTKAARTKRITAINQPLGLDSRGAERSIRNSSSALFCELINLSADSKTVFSGRVKLLDKQPIEIALAIICNDDVRKTLYIPFSHSNPLGPVMDALVSILAMPFGVFLCFGPAMLVWYLTERKSRPAEKPPEQSRSIRP